VCAGACGGDGSTATPDAPGPRPDAAPETCDTVQQDCIQKGNAQAPKCSLVFTGTDIGARCVALDGHLAKGASCDVTFGRDDCDAGLFCSSVRANARRHAARPRLPLLLPRRHNLRRRRALHRPGHAHPQDRICVPSGCALFDATSPASFSCQPAVLTDRLSYVGLCRSAGHLALDSDCSTGAVCAGGSVCVANPDHSATCRPDCDATHACATGTCRPLMGLPNAGGFCR
jgi:hypothetical protein